MNAAMMLVCMAGSMTAGQRDKPVFEAPLITVHHDVEYSKEKLTYTVLMYHHTYMARNYQKPKNRAHYGKADVDYSRLPTTYFHDQSPIGMALKKYNWFPGKTNTYHADARLPASIAAMTATLHPYANLVNLWSEPPIAVLGMDAGTLASYARPAQTLHFTERVPVFVKLSLPGKDETRHFHFVQDALDRGAALKIFEGEPREMLDKNGGDGFYQIIVIETYKLPVVNVHKELMTKEAIQMMLGKLRDGGILCYHASNRYYELAPIIAAAAESLGCAYSIARDYYRDDRDEQPPRHRFGSEWVLVARKEADLADLKAPPGFKPVGNEKYWSRDLAFGKKILWTDRGENSFRGVYRSDPNIDLFNDSLSRWGGWIGDRVGIPNHWQYQAMRPVQEAIRAWSVRSAEALNREPAKSKDKDDPKQ